MQLWINNWSAALAAEASAGAEQLAIDPAAAAQLVEVGGDDYYLLTLVDLDEGGQETGWEIVKVTAVGGGVLNVQRAQEGTTARSWGIGTRVSLRVTAGSLATLRDTAGKVAEILQSLSELQARITALEPPAHILLLEVEFTAESWWFGDYPAIVSVQGMAGDTVEADLDLSLFEKAGAAGADVIYDSGSGGVQIGYSDRYTAINTGTPRASGWTKVRIGLSSIGSFDGVINALNQLEPRDEIGSQVFTRGDGIVYVDVAV